MTVDEFIDGLKEKKVEFHFGCDAKIRNSFHFCPIVSYAYHNDLVFNGKRPDPMNAYIENCQRVSLWGKVEGLSKEDIDIIVWAADFPNPPSWYQGSVDYFYEVRNKLKELVVPYEALS